MEQRPKVGVGVIVINDGKILMQKRKGAHGSGSWSFPGGHLEFNEELEECARRETREEFGITIKNIRFGALTNDIFPKESKHYITVFMIAEHESREATVQEQEYSQGCGWFSWDDLPQPLFIPIQNLLKQGFNPFQ